jgi:hypothetical protein
MNGYHCFNFTEKLSYEVYPQCNQKMSNFHFDLSLQKFSGEVQNDLRGGAHLPTPPLKIRPCHIGGHTLQETSSPTPIFQP